MHFITEPTAHVDRKLAQIRQGLEAGLGRDFDFYDSDVRMRWDLSASGPWDEYLRLASNFRHTGRMQPDELKYKLDIGRKLATGREGVLNNAKDWRDLVKRGISRQHHPLHSAGQLSPLDR